MKKRLLIVFAFMYSTTIYSQKLAVLKIPLIVKESFKNAHPTATPSWEWEHNAYEANFVESGKAASCVIDKQGIILETESSIPLNELPANARAYINNHYGREKRKEVAKIVKAGGEVAYEVNIRSEDVLFNSDGIQLEKPKEKKEKD